MRRQILVTLLLTLALPATAASAAPLPAGTTAVISGAPDLLSVFATPVGAATSGGQAISNNGSRVAFTATSDGLVADDDDSVSNVYVKDFAADGAVQLVSRANGVAGEPTHADCDEAAISGDGTKVTFTCTGSLDAADTNQAPDVYVRDLVNRTTTLVSRASGGGAVSESGANAPAIDASGTFVVFVSDAGNLVAGIGAGVERIYRRRLDGNKAVIPVSVAIDGRVNASGAARPSISDNGAKVAFDTDDALDPDHDANGAGDVYLRDVDAGTTQLVSRADGANSAAGNGESSDGILSGDGTAVAFASKVPDLDPAHADADDLIDAYMRVPSAGTTGLLSITADGTKGNGDSTPTSVSFNGGAVAFGSVATNLDAAGDGRFASVFVKSATELRLASGDVRVAFGGSLGADGGLVTMFAGDSLTGTGTRVVRRELAGATEVVSRPAAGVPFANDGGTAFGGAVSADGRSVAFVSDAPAFGAAGLVGAAVFVRDVPTGGLVLASRADGPGGAPLVGVEGPPAISADGRRVAFAALSGNLVQIYVRDLPAGRTFLASVPEDGSPARRPGLPPVAQR